MVGPNFIEFQIMENLGGIDNKDFNNSEFDNKLLHRDIILCTSLYQLCIHHVLKLKKRSLQITNNACIVQKIDFKTF